jgi:RNA polymerase sigma factor (sigma-70 family)
MPDDLSPVELPLSDLSLASLQECCLEELERYRRTRSDQESVCCLEIVRRAVAEQNDSTFAALMHISQSIIQKCCPSDLWDSQDDVTQEVAVRLFHKFHRAEQLFTVTNFPAYISYVHMTCKSAAQEVRRQRQSGESLDNLRQMKGFEPTAPIPTDEVERRMLLERWLALLPDPQMRDAFRRRFALSETPDEIAEALGISKRDVYRLVEQAIRVLKDIPEVRDMLES